ncbi:thiamine pyrophosphate-dependent enzyme [Demequina muriae]|uniref:Thiamine pyrophosphate-binding protein n=1 Tax=Demequina muriae TaxID=3051664 RepID=A0ABT8GH81_9MICO|nr:thiamine pyrophosphate-dependent enzyme [Demequina sp. EGI L300058]MDN4480792.1 thiamine pyrophosphate-binding protein [Demequina sp. EGI L300058]
MTRTIAGTIVHALAEHGVTQVWGVVGDALNPFTEAMRHEDRLEWIGVRHEETAAFAAGAQSQLTDRIGVCMGTVGPGSLHLLNGLYDAKKSHAPVLAICGQVPTAEIGTDYFQEVHNDRVFADVAVWNQTLTSPEQLPQMLVQAITAAYSQRGVAVLTVPGDVGELELDADVPELSFARPHRQSEPVEESLAAAAAALNGAERVTMLVGRGAEHARDQTLAVAERLQAPMVVTLKGKSGFDGDHPYGVGQAGLLGNPGAADALADCDALLMVGTDFPYRDFYPTDATVVQIDRAATHVGRRVTVDVPVVGDAGDALTALLPRLAGDRDSSHLDAAVKSYDSWRERQRSVADPDYEKSGVVAKVRAKFDNPDDRIRPEALAAAVDRHAPDDAVFTVDTGMSTVWLARFVEMRAGRELIGSFNLGSMANALPQSLGAQALDRSRRVVSMSGDGGLMMLLGDLRTAVTHRLPVVVVVFDNASLGMVQLEQQQGGLPSFGTELDNPDLAAVGTAMGLASRRVEEPGDLDAALAWAFSHDGPVLLDVITNPDEISVPPHPKVSQAWGYAVAKLTEGIESRR